jgi:nucleoredoxin
MAALAAMLGDSLVGQGGATQSTAAALEGKGAVALYFSAHWCPPCRGFTPKLAEWYKKDLKDKGLEVVFVSSDRDQESFKEYFGEQPWLALPFEDRARKDSLSKKFKVQGIPSLVIVDSEGKTITKDGRSAISEDPTGAEFPWKPAPLSQLLAKAKIVDNDGGSVTVQQTMSGKKALALYFSAHWCPPCRGFTPQLAEWYKKDLKDKGLEVVFVSSDRDQESFKEYFGEQPWLALDFADRELKDKLSSALKVQGIPSLVILDSDLNVVTDDGRAAVSGDPEGNELPWHPKPVRNFKNGPGDINETPTLVVMCEEASKDDQAAIQQALEPIAARYIEEAKRSGDDSELCFIMGTESGELVDKVRGLVGLSAEKGTRMILIDIPDNGGYYVAEAGAQVITSSVEEFLASYKAGTLERKQLG